MTKELSTEEKFAILLAHVGYLQNEIDHLKERLAKYENPKNSKNSSKPPSSDFPKLQRTQSLREPSGKKPGGQFGHEGTTLKMVSTPNIIEDHSPFNCTCCGEDLSSEPGLFSGRRQVIDIPPIVPIVTEHQLFDKLCKCGHMNKTSYSMGVIVPFSFGENVQALIAYMSTRQLVLINRTSEIFTDVFGLSISTGGIDYILNKVKSKAAATYESIRQSVLKNKVIGADETKVNINGNNHWAWTFQNDKATFIAIHQNRGYAAIEQIMLESFHNNILVTDCWASYFKTDALSHQICIAHLLMELKYLKDRYQNSTWAERMSLLIVNALALRKTDYITKASVDEVLRSFRDLTNEPINSALKEVIPFHKRMVKYADFVFNFLQYEDVPPDINGSERAIRNFKTKLKISGLFRSDEGAERSAIIRSIIDTAIKNNRNPLHITKLIAQYNVLTE